MRKKILSILVVVMFVSIYSMPVFATGQEETIVDVTQEILNTEGDVETSELLDEPEEVVVPGTSVEAKDTLDPKAETGSVSEYAEVQAAYEAFIAVEAGLKNGDYDAMRTAYTELETASDKIDDAEEAVSADWERVVGEVIGEERYIDVVFDAAFIIMVNEDLTKAFNENKNAGTAYVLIDLYESMKEVMAESYGVDLDTMLSEETKAAIAEAEAYYPSEDVLAVYEAWEVVDDALFGPYPDEFDNAIKEFESVLDIYNEMKESDLEQLAGLLGVDGAEAAFDKIMNDWVNLNVLNELVDRYDVYDKNPNKETAQSFVEYYESIFNDPEYDDPELKEMAAACFEFDIEAEYNEAKALLNSDAKDNGNNEKDNNKKDNGNSPATGDDTPVPLLAGLMILSAIAAAGTVMRRHV